MPHSFIHFRRVMRIPNMCLVLKLDYGKVVSIANEQTESQTESIIYIYLKLVEFSTHTWYNKQFCKQICKYPMRNKKNFGEKNTIKGNRVWKLLQSFPQIDSLFMAGSCTFYILIL